jgi:serine/threonine protein kinase
MAEPTTEKLSPSKAAARRVGTDLNSKWHIDRVLGVGGMGAVFAVTHRNNGTRAAIKVLHSEYARAEDVRERFLREGRIANRVDHPARVAVVDDGVSDLEEPFLVMELLEGMTLSELFKRGGGRMALDKLLGIFDTVLDLLAKCHDIEVVHRDIKPANIFLTKQGAVKVLDFGVARMREPEAGVEATRAGIALGTASFIAPEQALGVDKLDGRADLFSVGACLYTGIVGERLHAAKTEAEEFILAATQSAPSVARKVPDVVPEVAAFVDKALAYDRVHRFQSARDMRTQLLKLQAAVKSGTLKAARKATGVVVKGSDAIDEGPDLSDAELRQQTDALTSIFKHLGNAMSWVRQYGLGHPQTQKALAQGYQEISAALASNPHSVRWDVMSGAFLFESEPVWAPDRVPFDRIPHQLFADGIRKVQFKPGISEAELRDFLAIMLRDVSTLFGTEDDSLTALWDRRFEHIGYLAVDSFAEGDNLEPDRMMDWQDIASRTLENARIDKDFDVQSTEEQAIELNLAARLKDAGEAASQLALDPATKATLGAQLGLTQERWLEAFLDAFVPALLDAKRRGDAALIDRALKEWVDDQMSLFAAESVFELHGKLTAALRVHLDVRDAHQVELETARVMFPIEVLRSVMSDISQERRVGFAGPRAAGSKKDLVLGLGRALELLASDAVFSLACECLDSARSEELREVIEPYLRRWAAGKEGQLATTLARSGAELGRFIVSILMELGTKEALSGIESAYSNPNVEVRLTAMSALGEAAGDRAREEIAALLDGPDVAMRLRTLELVGNLNVVAAGPILGRRIQSDGYNDLSVEERKRWLETVTALKASRGEALAIDLLSKRRILSNDASEQTRVIAAEHLAQCESPEAIEALQTAVKQRWGTSAAVREAATRSIAAIEARQSAKSKRPEQRSEGKS